MPTSYTSLLGLALPVTGELAGQWGTTVNDYITQYVDSSVAGTQTISGSQTAVTLSVTNGSSLVTAGSGATGSAQFQIINCTGNPAGLLTITAPASSRQYIIINATSTSQSVKIVGTGPTTGVTILSGEKAHVAWNGSDFVKIATQSGNGDFVTVDTTNLEVTNIKAKDGTAAASIADSTGVISITSNPILSGGTANGVLYLNGSKVATSGSVLVFDGTNLGLGVTPSAWYVGAGTSKAIQFNASSALYDFSASGNRQTHLINNAYLNTSANWIYLNTDAASRYVQNAGIHSWHTAASGTAGNTISFTQAMTLDASGNLRLGTTSSLSAADRLTVVGGNIAVQRTSGITTFMGDNTQDGYVGTVTNHAFAFLTNSTERMRLDSSGNLGLGTTSPTNYANFKTFEVAAGGGTKGGLIRWSGASNTVIAYAWADTTSTQFWFGTATSHPLVFGTNDTERMRLDSSGNLGLGVTPSAWGGSYKAIQFASGAIAGFSTTALDIYGNAYDSGAGAWKYLNSSQGATRYAAFNGSHQWFNAPTGTAGNAITFTQAMTLDASGKLLINATTSPSAATVKVAIQGASGADSYYQFGNGSGGGGLIGSVVSGGIQMYTYTGAFGSETYTERARITSGGALLIGTTDSSAANRLAVYGDTVVLTIKGGNSSTNVTSGTPDQVTWRFNDSTVGNYWMNKVLNNGGNTVLSWGVQSTSHSANFNNGKFFIEPAIVSTPATFIVDGTTGYTYCGYSSSNGAYKFQVNGQIFATSSTIATSDGRYKENVQDLTGALDLVNALRPVSFNWKKHNVHNFNTEDTTVGFIAQEVRQAMADKPYLNSFIKVNKCTSYDEVGQKDCDEEFMGLAETNMIAILTKALQELNAKFDAYVASHP